MNPIDKELMMGMIDILNNHSNILTEDQIALRLEDLKQFEEETNFVFMNSPTCKDRIGSVIEFGNTLEYRFFKCHTTKDIVEFANQKEMLIYPNILGEKVLIDYSNGIMRKLMINNLAIDFSKIKNIPYKFNDNGDYTVYGVLQGLNFYVTDVVYRGDSLKCELGRARDFGFETVPHWFATELNDKKLQSSIDYVFEYVSDEDLLCNGIVFRFNDISYSQDGIVYEMLNK